MDGGTDNAETKTVRIVATDYVDPDGSVVKSGLRLADAVLCALGEAESVIVSLAGLRGASSSYFNVFLRRIYEAAGRDVLDSGITLEFASALQREIYDRSRQAVMHDKPPGGKPRARPGGSC